MRVHKRVSVDWLKPGPLREGVTHEYLLGLGASMAVRQLQPICCRTTGDLLYGNTRVAAAKLAKLSELDAYVTDEEMSPVELEVMKASENLLRIELTSYEKTLITIRLSDLGLPQKEIAEQLHIEQGYVTKLLSYTKAVPEVQEAYRAGSIGVGDLYAISRAGNAEQHEMLRDRLGGVSREDLERRMKRKRNVAAPSGRRGRIKCQLSSGISVVVSGSSVSLDEFIEALAEAIRHAKKAVADKLDVKTWVRVMADKAKAG